MMFDVIRTVAKTARPTLCEECNTRGRICSWIATAVQIIYLVYRDWKS